MEYQNQTSLFQQGKSISSRNVGLLLGSKRAQAHLPLHKRGGQATLELALTFIVITLFLLGVIKTTLWFGNNLGGRAQYYNAGRTRATASPIGTSDFGYQQTRLSFFGEGPSPFNTLPGDFDRPEISEEYTEWVAQLDALREQMNAIYAELGRRGQRVQDAYNAWRKHDSGFIGIILRAILIEEANSFRAYSNTARAQLDVLNESMNELYSDPPALYASDSSS